MQWGINTVTVPEFYFLVLYFLFSFVLVLFVFLFLFSFAPLTPENCYVGV